MGPTRNDVRVETKAEAEALIPLFAFEKILNQGDQSGRRINLLGTIKNEQAILSLERAAFASENGSIGTFLSALSNTTNLGANDVYRWYMANHMPTVSSSDEKSSVPDLKLNLIYPCTETHIKKYRTQPLRYVTETPLIYQTYIGPWIEKTQCTPKRLDWIHNILDGITEQEDVIYRSEDFESDGKTGFLLLPDLNWDRKTLQSLHLLALVQRRDLHSLRDLRRSDAPWLKSMLSQIRIAAAQRGTELAAASGSSEVMESDQIKCYVHYQPTYYHFHIHVVHVMLEPEGGTQSVGKAIGLENLIGWLDGLEHESIEDPGLDTVDITYHLGEASELWTKCFEKLKRDEEVTLLN